MTSGREPQEAWQTAFAGSIASVVVALAIFTAIVGAAWMDGDAAARPVPAAATVTPTPASIATETAAPMVASLLYSGELPAQLDGDGLRPAVAGEAADVSFTQGAEGGVITAFFVAVVDLTSGVLEVSREEFDALLAGTIVNWSEIGGVDLPVRYAVVAGADGAVGEFAGSRTADLEVTSYEELAAAMTPGSGIVAIVPVEELRPALTALSIGGTDLLRGRGDAGAWPLVQRVAVEGLTERGRGAAPVLRGQLAARSPKGITVIATGDTIPVRCSLAAIEATGDWAASLRGEMGEYLAGADLALTSLDTSIQDFSEPFRCVQTVNLTTRPEIIEMLTYAGIDGITVATNHIFDCGEVVFCGTAAFLSTLDRLAAAGIKTVGGGRNLEEALAPAIFEVRGVTFGVLGFDDVAAGPPNELAATEDSPGTAPLDDDYSEERLEGYPAFYAPAEMLGLERFTASIRALKEQVDFVIVQVQSGTEETHAPSPRSLKALRAAVDAGADLVIGNQAHWPQAVETRDEAFVAYALGNFVYDQTATPEHRQGYLVESIFREGRLINIRLRPIEIEEKYRPVFVEGGTKVKILGDVATAAQNLPSD